MAAWLAPIVGVTRRLADSRWLGETQIYTADAVANATHGLVRPLAERLAGAALVRVSSRLWRCREWPDVLGLGLRFFGRPKAHPESLALQDLLLVAAESRLALPLALVRTNARDFLANRYHVLDPLETEGLGRVRVRASWPAPAPPGPERFARLMAAVVTQSADLSLELQSEAESWTPLLRVRLRVPAVLDEQRLRLSALNDRGGLRVTGLVGALWRRGPLLARRASRTQPGATAATSDRPARRG